MSISIIVGNILNIIQNNVYLNQILCFTRMRKVTKVSNAFCWIPLVCSGFDKNYQFELTVQFHTTSKKSNSNLFEKWLKNGSLFFPIKK